MVADCVCCLSQDGRISAIRMYPLRLYKVGKTPIQNRSMNYSCFFNIQMVEEAVEAVDAMGVYLNFFVLCIDFVLCFLYRYFY